MLPDLVCRTALSVKLPSYILFVIHTHLCTRWVKTLTLVMWGDCQQVKPVLCQCHSSPPALSRHGASNPTYVLPSVTIPQYPCLHDSPLVTTLGPRSIKKMYFLMFYFKCSFQKHFSPPKSPSSHSLLLPGRTGTTAHEAVASKVPDELLGPA